MKVGERPMLKISERSDRGGGDMVKITELVRDSRNGGCPAVHAADAIRAQG